MKLLIWYCNNFEYNTTINTIEKYTTEETMCKFSNVLVAFIQVEENDEDNLNNAEKKMVKQIKWASGKNNTKKILLHSFAHLSDSKANPEFTKELLDKAQKRLENADYETSQTPFGYFLDLKMEAPGYSLARIFKSF